MDLKRLRQLAKDQLQYQFVLDEFEAAWGQRMQCPERLCTMLRTCQGHHISNVWKLRGTAPEVKQYKQLFTTEGTASCQEA